MQPLIYLKGTSYPIFFFFAEDDIISWCLKVARCSSTTPGHMGGIQTDCVDKSSWQHRANEWSSYTSCSTTLSCSPGTVTWVHMFHVEYFCEYSVPEMTMTSFLLWVFCRSPGMSPARLDFLLIVSSKQNATELSIWTHLCDENITCKCTSTQLLMNVLPPCGQK